MVVLPVAVVFEEGDTILSAAIRSTTGASFQPREPARFREIQPACVIWPSARALPAKSEANSPSKRSRSFGGSSFAPSSTASSSPRGCRLPCIHRGHASRRPAASPPTANSVAGTPQAASPMHQKFVRSNSLSDSKIWSALFGPDERLWILVVDGQVLLDRLLKLTRAAVAATTDLLLGERREPTLDLVDPGCTGRREVQVELRSAGQPVMNHRRLVGAVVIQHEMSVEPLRHRLGNAVEEPAELDSAMAPVALADYLISGHVQCREQRRGPMAAVISWVRRSGSPGRIGSTGCMRSRA